MWKINGLASSRPPSCGSRASDTAAAIEFYKKAFGAVEICRMPEPNGSRIMHATVRIGDSMMMMADIFPEYGGKGPSELGGSPVVLNIYCDNVDEVVESAAANGAKVNMPPTDMFWGDRYAKLTDPFGHEWSIATHVKDMTEGNCPGLIPSNTRT